MGPLDPWALWTWPLDPVPFGPKCPRIPSFSTIFSVARVVEKSTVLGIQSVDSMNPWRVWAHHSFNKDCSQSFSGPSGRPKEPTRGPKMFTFSFVAWVFETSTLLGAQSVDSLTLSGFQAKSLIKKECPQSFPGPLGRAKEPTRGPTFSHFFLVARVSEKSALLGTGSIDSLPLWGVSAKSLFNKDCLQSFPGPPGRPKEPLRGKHSQKNFKNLKNRERTELRS